MKREKSENLKKFKKTTLLRFLNYRSLYTLVPGGEAGDVSEEVARERQLTEKLLHSENLLDFGYGAEEIEKRDLFDRVYKDMLKTQLSLRLPIVESMASSAGDKEANLSLDFAARLTLAGTKLVNENKQKKNSFFDRIHKLEGNTTVEQ